MLKTELGRQAFRAYLRLLRLPIHWKPSDMREIVCREVGNRKVTEAVYWTGIYLRYAAPNGKPI